MAYIEFKNVKKIYKMGDVKIRALNGVDFKIDKGEFAVVLGPSGAGKSTILNILGGMDTCTTGEITVDGKRIDKYNSRQLTAYRRYDIGFVFQFYNLVQNLTVKENVELATQICKEPLDIVKTIEAVGLSDRMGNFPSQLSGGEQQRVAIARALVNNPDILLADEPTGALDTETSIQIMELLKEISKDRLIIMVTHNPELAKNYSTRIVRLLDGVITDDSDPYTLEDMEADIKAKEAAKVKASEKKNKKSGKKQKTSMSFFTALSLSFNNLMTKKTRTILTAFAGSIGIIGIAMILSISNGIQLYIDRVQRGLDYRLHLYWL